ncbi:MAG: hypothetical protein ABI700_02400 [Chloroflexota bacterium]
MNDKHDYLPGFLKHLGIPAEVQRDAKNIALIIIETRLFNQRQGQIETYFRLVEQRGEYSYFRERTRGSEDTQ